MKIVFTIKPLNLCGGIERATVLIANELVERGHEVTIISFVGSETTPFFEIDKRINVYYLAPSKDKYPVVVRDIRRIILLKRYYKQIRPDVIVLSGATRSIVNIPAAKGYKVISWEHAAMNHHQYLITTRFSRFLSARYSECVVALTEHDANEYKRQFGAKTTVVIPNPLTLYTSTPATLDEKVVVSVGRLVSIKGFDLLLEAWQKVSHKDWKLYIVGGGKREKKLRKQIAEQNIERVEMVGQSSDVEKYYKNASIYALSSRSESFGLVLTEAMSFGLPAVSFDCGAGPREIIENGVTGIIVPAEDTTAMAKALDSLMENTEQRKLMGKAALERVKRYTMDCVIAQWEELFKQVCKNSWML